MHVIKPIFFIGVPRSGTTIMFEVFSAHEALGWFSNWFNGFPGVPAISFLSRLANLDVMRGYKRPKHRKRFFHAYQLFPAESYAIWERYGRKAFSLDYLLNVEAHNVEKQRLYQLIAKTLAYHGKKRFANKSTGPSRITYLNSAFDNAHFIHIIRDGRAVVNSLINVGFWKENNSLTQPFWNNGLPNAYVQEWKNHQSSPLALAAVQWKNIIEIAREDSKVLQENRYLEIKYEDFLTSPYDTINRINDFCKLPYSEAQQQYLIKKVNVRNMNDKYLEAFNHEELPMLNNIMEALLLDLHYPVSLLKDNTR